MRFPHIAYGTPRKLPAPKDLPGRVAVLDIAFAAGPSSDSFDKITKRFIDGLGDRLAIWIDHHDHVMRSAYAHDPRFVLRSKGEHGACPEMVTPERIRLAGPVDTVCCHSDFDGLCSAAKWIREGIEPYPGADQDARAIDTRVGDPSDRAATIDRALRARKRDPALRDLAVRFLATGAEDVGLYEGIQKAAEELRPLEQEAERIAQTYQIRGRVAVVDVEHAQRPYDKTALLLLGQDRAPIAVAHDHNTVTVAARFDSGIDLLQILSLQGGMPTVVSLPGKRLEDVLGKLGWSQDG